VKLEEYEILKMEFEEAQKTLNQTETIFEALKLQIE
jgi:hypothetical protein